MKKRPSSFPELLGELELLTKESDTKEFQELAQHTIAAIERPLCYPEEDFHTAIQRAISLERLRLRCIEAIRKRSSHQTLIREEAASLHPFSFGDEMVVLYGFAKSMPFKLQAILLPLIGKRIDAYLKEILETLEARIRILGSENANPLLNTLMHGPNRPHLAVVAKVCALMSETRFRIDDDRNGEGRRFTPTIQQVLQLLSHVYPKEVLNRALRPESILFHQRILLPTLNDIPNGRWQDVGIRVNDGLLLNEPDLSDRESMGVVETTCEPQHKMEELVLPEDEKRDILAFIKAYRSGRIQGLSFLFHGRSGVGKTSLSHAIAAELGMKVVTINAENIPAASLPSIITFLLLKYSQSNSILLFDECETLWYRDAYHSFGERNRTAERSGMKKVLDDLKGCVIFASNVRPPEAFVRRVSYCLEMKRPTIDVRRRIFKKRLGALSTQQSFQLGISDPELEELSDHFDLPAGFLNRAATLAALRGTGAVTAETLQYALGRVNELAGETAISVRPRMGLEVLSLSHAQKETVDRFLRYTKANQNRKTLDPLMPKGVTALFEGPPGVGKTVLAEALAKELGYAFKAVTPSSFLSKWVGDTEKAIAGAFESAQGQQTLLFLDEAEGMLGSRADARASWEKTQIDEWLKQIENFPGVFIAATNHREMMDPAFARRFLFHFSFELPSAEQRMKFLKKHLGGDLPDRELELLGKRHDLSFGELRNAIVNFRTYTTPSAALLDQLLDEQAKNRFHHGRRPVGIR